MLVINVRVAVGALPESDLKFLFLWVFFFFCGDLSLYALCLSVLSAGHHILLGKNA